MSRELNVKVGDQVLYSYWTFSGTKEQIKTVSKVTPSGRIRVEGSNSQFNKYGREMGVDSSGKLSIPTEEDYKRIEEKAAISRALFLMNEMTEKTLSYEKALEIIKILDKTD